MEDSGLYLIYQIRTHRGYGQSIDIFHGGEGETLHTVVLIQSEEDAKIEPMQRVDPDKKYIEKSLPAKFLEDIAFHLKSVAIPLRPTSNSDSWGKTKYSFFIQDVGGNSLFMWEGELPEAWWNLKPVIVTIENAIAKF